MIKEYEWYEAIYLLFKDYNFNLSNKIINNNSIQLDFSKQENIIDKFSIIKNNNNYITIIPLKKNNNSYRTEFNNLYDVFIYLQFHLYNYIFK
tara:strand:- start:5008 stop:5286 length:279 start_codon:yes stop_codon:yes gene_type:complete